VNKTTSYIAHGCLYFYTFLKIFIALIFIFSGSFMIKNYTFTTARITHLDNPNLDSDTTPVTVLYDNDILATLTINGTKHHVGEIINVFYDSSDSFITLSQGSRSSSRYLILFGILLFLFAIAWFFFIRYLLGKNEKDKTPFQQFITYFYAGDCIFSLFTS
jgi:predicted membrane protein